MGCVCVYMQEMELLYWKEYADEKKVKLVEKNRSLIPWRVRVPI